jgi:L-galactonate dehydratase
MITPAEAIQLLRSAEPGTQARLDTALENRAVVGYSTSVGGLGTPDEEVERLLRSAMAEGFNRFKLRLGLGVERDRKRLGIIRSIAGPDAEIYVDANEQWDVPTALAYLPQLADFKPRFIEEPTSPDDILGHKRVRDALKQCGIGVATGEHVNNRVMFKQFISAGAIDFLQLDAVRLSGINEILAVLLMAAKHDIPVVPHAG